MCLLFLLSCITTLLWIFWGFSAVNVCQYLQVISWNKFQHMFEDVMSEVTKVLNYTIFRSCQRCASYVRVYFIIFMNSLLFCVCLNMGNLHFGVLLSGMIFGAPLLITPWLDCGDLIVASCLRNWTGIGYEIWWPFLVGNIAWVSGRGELYFKN